MNGYAEQNPEEWWCACQSCLAVLRERYAVDLKKIRAISFSGQMHGMVALDEKKRVIRPAILHCDTRSSEQLKELSTKIGKEGQLNILRNPFNTGFLLPSLLWMKENEPQNYQRIRHVILPKDYLILKLTNQIATDYSDASSDH